MTHPTIKLLEELEQHFCPEGGNVFADCLVEDEEFFQIKNLSETQYDLLRECLRTLIEKHEDVEGDMPQEVYTANKEALTVSAENGEPTIIALACSTRPSGDTTPYHRSDTIINEIAKRIEDD